MRFSLRPRSAPHRTHKVASLTENNGALVNDFSYDAKAACLGSWPNQQTTEN